MMETDFTVIENKSITCDDTIKLEEIWTTSHKTECCDWLKCRKFKSVCLQFPENHLNFITTVIQDLKQNFSDTTFYVLADTPYGNCYVDEISAAHVDADCIIHFGNKCSKSFSRLPVLYIYPKFNFSLENFVICLADFKEVFSGKRLNVFLDIGYHHVACKLLNSYETNSSEFHFYPILYPFLKCSSELGNIQEFPCLFVGNDENQFLSLSVTFQSSRWFIYKAKRNSVFERDSLHANFLRRRYFHIEKCKDAQTIGIIISTLTAGYLHAVQRIQLMCQSRGTRTEIISVGRVNPEKLCNFFEVDCFVLVGCSCNRLYARKYISKPIVSVFEAELAFNPARRTLCTEKYITDFRDILPDGSSFLEFDSNNIPESDISLIDGCIRKKGSLNDHSMKNNCYLQRPKILLVEPTATLKYMDREWKGLEQVLGQAEAVSIQMGLSGVPIKYSEK